MAVKTKINDHGDVVFTEQDAIDLLYTNPEFDVSKLFFEDVKQYESALKELGLDLPTISTAPKRESIKELTIKISTTGICPTSITKLMCYNGY